MLQPRFSQSSNSGSTTCHGLRTFSGSFVQHRRFRFRRLLLSQLWSGGAAPGSPLHLGCGPFLGLCFKHIWRFVPYRVLSVWHGADQTSKNGQAAERKVCAAVFDPDLSVHAGD